MISKAIKITHKKKTYEYNVVSFDSLSEAKTLLGDQLLNVINLGNAVYAKAQTLGKNPFRQKKTRAKLDLTKIDEATLNKLRELQALIP